MIDYLTIASGPFFTAEFLGIVFFVLFAVANAGYFFVKSIYSFLKQDSLIGIFFLLLTILVSGPFFMQNEHGLDLTKKLLVSVIVSNFLNFLYRVKIKKTIKEES